MSSIENSKRNYLPPCVLNFIAVRVLIRVVILLQVGLQKEHFVDLERYLFFIWKEFYQFHFYSYLKKVCSQGQCISSALAQVTDCPFGDGSVPQNFFLSFPPQEMTCSVFLAWVATQNYAIEAFCVDPYIGSLCCQSCKSVFFYKSILIYKTSFLIK